MGRLVERDGIHHRSIVYDPLPSQKLFHLSSARFKGFSGPIGSGKSRALCQEAIRLAHLNPGRTGLIGAPTYPMLRDATQTALFEILEANGIPFTYCKSENTVLLQETGSRILFRSMDEYERLRGSNIAWFGMDELTYSHEEAWLRLEGRLRDPKAKKLCGFAVWTPKGYDWVYRRFIDSGVGRYEVIRARAYENRFILDSIPDYYERLKSSYDERFYQQEVLGEYLNAAGDRAYSAFEYLEHVKPQAIDPQLPISWAMDFNVDPMCSVVVQMDRDVVRVIDEIVLSRATTQDACNEFSRRYGGHLAGYTIYGDSSGNSQSTKGGSDYEIVKAHFRARRENARYDVSKGNPSVRNRVGTVNMKLKAADGEIRMMVDAKCRELIKDFEQVSFLDGGGTDLDKKKDRHRTHASDALGYLIYYEQRPQVRFGEKGHPI